MSAWFISDKIDISDKKLWKVYFLTGFELLLKSDYFSYRDTGFYVQVFRSHKWTWAEKEMKIVYLGMGTEFYLKALYLKKGFSIRQIDSSRIYSEKRKIKNANLFMDKSVTFHQMIEDKNMTLISNQQDIKILKLGLKRIQNWRNSALHSVSLHRLQSNVDFNNIVSALNILHNLLINTEKQLMLNIKHIATPWLRDRYPDGKFMKREMDYKRELVCPKPPILPGDLEKNNK